MHAKQETLCFLNPQVKKGRQPKNPRIHGGHELRGRADKKRHLSFKEPMHLVLKSQIAKGRFSLLTKARKIQEILYRDARQRGIKIYKLANSGNHLHLLIKVSDRVGYARWIRAVSPGARAIPSWRSRSIPPAGR